jgi:uncharacterized protein YjbI with pentapeptide repeats
MSDEPQRPTTDDRDAWKAYWEAKDMPWRTEPEIDDKRQKYLAERRAVTPDVEKGIYPFRDDNGSIKLDRADVEWLLATYESDGVHGPVDWEQERKKPEERRRQGISLVDADLTEANLRNLPLACTTLSYANLARAHLEGASLAGAVLRDAELTDAHLEQTRLDSANLESANLRRAYFDANTRLNSVLLGDQRGDFYAQLRSQRGGNILTRAAVALGNSLSVSPSFILLFSLAYIGALLRAAATKSGVFSSDPRVHNFLNPYVLVGLALAQACVFGLALYVRRRRMLETGALLGDIHWQGVDLAVVDWQRVGVLGEEKVADARRSGGRRKTLNQ